VVFALADPGARGLRVTAGAVSSEPQSLRGPRGRLVEGLIEHTAPLPRGSAGGPLLDASGALLGINAVRQAHGLILALPLTGVREALEQAQAGQAPRQRRLGVAVVSPRMARRLRRAVGLTDRDGVLVRGVAPESPAAGAGLQRGDLIVGMAGGQIGSLDELFAALDAAPLQQPLALQIVRGEQESELEVVLGDR
jgi:serine protease Do